MLQKYRNLTICNKTLERDVCLGLHHFQVPCQAFGACIYRTKCTYIYIYKCSNIMYHIISCQSIKYIQIYIYKLYIQAHNHGLTLPTSNSGQGLGWTTSRIQRIKISRKMGLEKGAGVDIQLQVALDFHELLINPKLYLIIWANKAGTPLKACNFINGFKNHNSGLFSVAFACPQQIFMDPSKDHTDPSFPPRPHCPNFLSTKYCCS